MTTRWLSDDELNAWMRLAAVVELLPGVLDAQLTHDAELTHYEYFAMARLNEAPHHTLRTTQLAQLTNATLPRLSNVARRLEARGLLERFPCPDDRRATNIRLTSTGQAKVKQSAPGHVGAVREHVIDALTPVQITQLTKIAGAILARIDPADSIAAQRTTAPRIPQL